MIQEVNATPVDISRAMRGERMNGLLCTRVLESGTIYHVFYPMWTQETEEDRRFAHPDSAWGKSLCSVMVPEGATLHPGGEFSW